MAEAPSFMLWVYRQLLALLTATGGSLTAGFLRAVMQSFFCE